MSFFDSVKRYFIASTRKTQKRGFFAATLDRLTTNWSTSSGQIDSDLRGDIAVLRSRARELAKNNDYAKKYLRLVKQNVIGSDGFILQVKSYDLIQMKGKTQKKLDEYANRTIEEHFYKWGDNFYADITGKLTFRKLIEVVLLAILRDGEIFVRKITGGNVNPYGFSLQLIPADYVDHTYNQELKNGRYIRMGIEYDSYGRPLAYHVTKTMNANSELWATVPTGDRVRIPAGDIIHLFDQEHAIQSRGYSWLTQSMWRLFQLGKFEEASVVNARVTAAKMGFFKDTANSGLDGEYHEDQDGNLIDAVEPGSFQYIGDKDFVGFDPKFPTDQYEGFTKRQLMGIASGMGVSYNTLCNDLEGVSYSSIRAGLLDEREFYKEIQGYLRDYFLIPVFAVWLKQFLISGLTSLPAAKFDKFNQPVFIGRRWQWVDPLKDVQASKLAVEQGFKTRQQVISEQGGDFLETMEALQYEQEVIQNLNIKIGDTNEPDTNSGAGANDKESPDDTAGIAE